MRTTLRFFARRGVRIAGAVVLSLLGLALLPLLALPYGGLDWLAYDPSYKGAFGRPPIPTPIPDIPCAELPGPGEPLVARVNGQGIGLGTFEREMAQFLSALEDLGADPESAEFQAELPLYRRQVLDLLIDDVLVQQAAVEADITVTDDEIVTRVAEEVAAGGGLDLFQAWLEETGQTWEEFRRDVCQDILRQAVFEHVTADISGPTAMVRARQIVVATEKDGVEVLTRLASGETFDSVARESSLDAATRDQGGDLGWFPRGLGLASPEVEDAAFAGAPGQVQGPIQSDETYAIVQTLEYQAERSLDPGTQEELQALAFEGWLARRREAAEIEIFIDLDSKTE